MPSTLGMHYELPWLTDYGWKEGGDGVDTTYGTFIADKDGNKKLNPERTKYSKLFTELGAPPPKLPGTPVDPSSDRA
tara:strand:- start:542 stop:772 length:231 start_codon:yes stop_codon:yes gene_type:complete